MSVGFKLMSVLSCVSSSWKPGDKRGSIIYPIECEIKSPLSQCMKKVNNVSFDNVIMSMFASKHKYSPSIYVLGIQVNVFADFRIFFFCFFKVGTGPAECGGIFSFKGFWGHRE